MNCLANVFSKTSVERERKTMAKPINTTHATQLWNDGLIDREIAAKLNCVVGTVRRWRDKNDLPSNAGIFNWDPHGYIANRRKKKELERGVLV